MNSMNSKIHVERIKHSFKHQVSSSATSLLLSLIFYSGYFQAKEPLVHLWVALHVFSFALRMLYLRNYSKNHTSNSSFDYYNRAENIYAGLVAISCLLWGFMPYVFFHITSKDYIPLLYGMYFGVLVGGISRTDTSIKLSKVYIFGFVTPFMFFGLSYPTKPNILLSICALIFASFLFKSLKKQYKHYFERAMLTLENIAMNEELKGKLELEKELQKERASNFQNAKLASIGELAAGVAHEINNPLSIAMGYLITIEKNSQINLSDKDIERIGKINAAHIRIKNIVKGLRNFSRTDTERNDFFNLSETITESVLFVKEIYLKQGVEIEMSLEEDICLWGNQGEVQQVIMNLLANAKDAVVDNIGKMRIEVKLYSDDQSITLKVRDNGCGIPDEIQQQIFDPFFTTKGVSKGTGIGLSITHRIVTNHQGKIKVASRKGEYTEIELNFPLTQASYQNKKQAA